MAKYITISINDSRTIDLIMNTCLDKRIGFDLTNKISLTNNGTKINEITFCFQSQDYAVLFEHLWRQDKTSSDILLIMFNNMFDEINNNERCE